MKHPAVNNIIIPQQYEYIVNSARDCEQTLKIYK